MIEARVFTDSLDSAKTMLERETATLKVGYEIIDTIYRSADTTVPLIDEFLRLRVVPQNIWDDKAVVLALKRTKLQTVGKRSDIPLKLQFDDKADALTHIAHNLQDKFIESFTFSRVGWQYLMDNGDVVDLEVIEDTLPSIEFKSDTTDGVNRLLAAFAVDPVDVISGPSVVAVKKKLRL